MTESFEGASCTATLDAAAGTLTFAHRGWTATAEQKKLSPLVVPLGAIEAVEHDWGRFTGWFRIVRRGETPWPKKVHTDPHGLTCGEDPGPFAERVRAAVASAEPLAPPAEPLSPPAEPLAPPADPLPPPVEPVPHTSKPDAPSTTSKVAKGVGKSIVDGIFRSW